MKIVNRHRLLSGMIPYAVWLYFHFTLSHRDIKDLLAQRGVVVSHEATRLWCNRFGATLARQLRKKHQGLGDAFYIDELFVKIEGKQHY